jgi:exosortase A-associated hydrolase 2
MNKCRRMVTETALELCRTGYAVLVPDLFGTGDSGGDFREARWSLWEDDLAAVCAWGADHGLPVTSVIAIRLGAALTISAARNGRIPTVESTVLWQPALDGSNHLAQFLRLRTAAAMFSASGRESVAELRSRLACGESIEVAGYDLSGELAADLERIRPPAAHVPELGAVHWMELVRSPDSGIPASQAAVMDCMRGSGGHITAHVFVGEPFWATVEIARIPEMIHATAHCISAGSKAVVDDA